MTIDFYYAAASAPCVTVQLAAKLIGVELNLKPLNLYAKEHLTPEFLKINPQHSVPTINDNGFAVWESRAIITYLQNKYGKDDSLYPKDPKKRAVVDQRLFFDLDFTARLHFYKRSIISGGSVDSEKLEQFNKYQELLDTFLGKTEFVAGDNLTLADLPLVIQFSNLELIKHDLSAYKNISRWYSKVKATIPGYKEATDEHLATVKQNIENRLK